MNLSCQNMSSPLVKLSSGLQWLDYDITCVTLILIKLHCTCTELCVCIFLHRAHAAATSMSGSTATMEHMDTQALSTAPDPTPPMSLPSSQQSQLSMKPFNCPCGRNFDTQRGLSMHWAHEKDHRYMDSTKFMSSSEQVPVEPPSPQPVSPSPLDSPTSAPESPPYNMASFKTSARNPQYYSIIRTRRSSEHHSNAPSMSAVEVGAKRPRGSTGTATTPPAKAMQLNTKERLPVGEDMEMDRDRECADVGSPQKRRPREKEGKKETLSGQQRPRTRSLSSSDNSSPPLKPSLSVPNEMGSVRGGAGLRSSPVTRSNAATMKTEFISLPARRRRGGGRRGRGRGAAAGRGRGQDNMDEDREYVSMEMDYNESQLEEPSKEELEPPQQPPPPVKRRRGRPPKNRNKEVLVPTGSSKSAPTSTQTTPNITPSNSAAGSSSAKQMKAAGRGRGGRAAIERDSAMEEQEENPLDIKSSKLPPWVDETDEPTSKQQTSEALTPINESASLPVLKSHSSKSESASSVTSTKENKSKTQESDQYEGAISHSQGRRGRKKTTDGSRGQNSETAVTAEEEKEIKTRSRAKSSRKASESTSEKETPPSASPPVKEDEEGTESEKDSAVASRPSSVIVSVLSGPESKGPAAPVGASSSNSGGGGMPDEQKHDHSQSMVSADEKTAVSDTQQFKHSSVNESVPPMMGYPPPPTSAPTPTYPYSYTGAYPPPHPIMYPPGPASSMYPYYYHPGSAGSQPPPIMPHPYHLSPVPPPPPVMMPAEQQGGSGTGLPSPHHSMNPFQFQTTSPSPNGPAPNTTVMAMSQSAATTVGGVRVTLLDKPPTQMPTVTVPHPVSRSHPIPTSVYPGHTPMTDHAGNPTSPMGQVPLIRPSYIPTAGAHSPEGELLSLSHR